MPRIPVSMVNDTLKEKLIKHGVSPALAGECADVLCKNSIDGIYSHGVNRFPRLISYLDKGYIKPQNEPVLVASYGALEKWDGNLGMGVTNAKLCMDRAIGLARKYGIGCVALRNTNHWMRGGTYGLQAADAGCIGICWTNTQPNMPAWGAQDRRIGNNPLILCVPYKNGHVMMDGAMAQFSYGAIESARLAGKKLPVPGGFDTQGNITDDPAEIEKTWRVLPIGYWKGSSMSILLDMIAACLSEGNAVHDVGSLGEDEFGLSQVLIAMYLGQAGPESDAKVEAIIQDIKGSVRVNEGQEIFYPNEMSYPLRQDNLAGGIPVNDEVWAAIQAL